MSYQSLLPNTDMWQAEVVQYNNELNRNSFYDKKKQFPQYKFSLFRNHRLIIHTIMIYGKNKSFKNQKW